MEQLQQSLKQKTAKTLKWNTIDRFAQQILYAVTGIILANLVSQEEFGLVGVMLVFQAFASLFVDSGFANALVQRKSPSETDYSTVFYFNIVMALAIYAILWVAAPLIDDLFRACGRLVPLSRVMFLTFILNATAIVQTNRLIKQMDVRLVALSDVLGLTIGCGVGIVLAVAGYGAWAIVWQSVSSAAVKSVVLWVTTKWRPMATFSFESLRSIFKIGSSVMISSFFNTLFLHIYSFIIGKYYNLGHLGRYTQADKWSKMGVASMSSILTTTFLPIMSKYQDDKLQFQQMMCKNNRLAAYLIMPFMGFLFVAAPQIFHALFGDKWDNAVFLFQILCIRGIFTVLTAVYNNFILAKGDAKKLIQSEIVKDVLTVIAIIATVSFGLEALVIGQLVAGVIYYLYSIWLTYKVTGYNANYIVYDVVTYVAVTAITVLVVHTLEILHINAWILLALQFIVGLLLYVGLNKVLGSKIQEDVFGYLMSRYRNKK